MTPPPYLDTPEAVSSVDSQNLHRILRELPDQFEAATREFAAITLPETWHAVASVVFCGMGGSAIGGELVATLPPELSRKPLSVVRGYRLPAYVGPDTLVVVVSYSGDTAEALACFAEAQTRHCPTLVVTGGGELGRLAHKAKIPLYQFSYQAPPRDSLGYLMAPLVHVLEVTGVLQPGEAELGEAVTLLRQQLTSLVPEVPGAQNQAKHLAYRLFDHLPLIIGTEFTAGVGRRWKNQINEHAKSASFSEVLPEADHNMVEGFTYPARFRDDVVVVILRSSFDQPEAVKRATYLKEYLSSEHVVCEEVVAQGSSAWAQKLWLVALGDWTSYYLALLNRVDPSAIAAITALKEAQSLNALCIDQLGSH